jgi:hypothetical protein
MPRVATQQSFKYYDNGSTHIQAVVDALALVAVAIHVQNVLVILENIKFMKAIASSTKCFKLN